MSSSLFYDCYATYEYDKSASTDFVEGEKTFEELKEGDIIYSLDKYQIKKHTVIKPWHCAKGKYYITLDKKVTICFGYTYNGENKKKNSIAVYNYTIFGTSPKCVIDKKINMLSKNISENEKNIRIAECYIKDYKNDIKKYMELITPKNNNTI